MKGELKAGSRDERGIGPGVRESHEGRIERGGGEGGEGGGRAVAESHEGRIESLRATSRNSIVFVSRNLMKGELKGFINYRYFG